MIKILDFIIFEKILEYKKNKEDLDEVSVIHLKRIQHMLYYYY